MCQQLRSVMVGVCDYLVAEGDQVFLSNLGFDVKTGKCTPAKSPSHLRGGIAGLLEASWFDDDLALRKAIHIALANPYRARQRNIGYRWRVPTKGRLKNNFPIFAANNSPAGKQLESVPAD